jgi:hypothetical protein
MAQRSAAGLGFLLIAVLVVAAPGMAPASSGDLSAHELCDLYPEDQGFDFIEAPGLNKCEATLGDCDQSTTDIQTCISAIVIQQATAEEARGMVRPAGDGPLEALAGLGEIAVGGCDPFWCEVQLQRDRFWLSVLVAPGLGIGAAQALAAQVDQEIERVVAGGSEPEEPPVEPEEPGQEPEEPGGGQPADSSESSSGFVAVFFGAEGVEAIATDIRRTVDCRNMDGTEIEWMVAHGGSTFWSCQGVVSGALLRDIQDRWEQDFPNPTPRQREGIEAYQGAVFLSGLLAQDGSWMFPSIRVAMPLIRRLSDPTAARRFIEMVAARDMADWEGRGLG